VKKIRTDRSLGNVNHASNSGIRQGGPLYARKSCAGGIRNHTAARARFPVRPAPKARVRIDSLVVNRPAELVEAIGIEPAEVFSVLFEVLKNRIGWKPSTSLAAWRPKVGLMLGRTSGCRRLQGRRGETSSVRVGQDSGRPLEGPLVLHREKWRPFSEGVRGVGGIGCAAGRLRRSPPSRPIRAVRNEPVLGSARREEEAPRSRPEERKVFG